MDVPSVKGSAFQSVAEDVKRLIDEGRIGPDDVDERLSDKDRGLLDGELTPLSWVPIGTYGRLLDLLAREEGGADPASYLQDRGARAAERLLSGSYSGFAAGPGTWGPRVGQAMIGIGKLLYNWTDWAFRRIEDDLYEIDCRDGGELPESAQLTATGFLHWFAEKAAGRPMTVERSRPEPERITFRIAPR